MAGYSGSSYDRYVQRTDNSTTHKLRSAYWTTKQAVMQKLGRPEDQHVVASDSELDSKLDLFRSVQKSCADLLRLIEHYQESLCALSQAENELGRFLKNKSGQSKTSANKMMAAVGKSLSFSAQQRLALRVPLGRLYQEVETFRYRAISDTFLTIQRMEATRTDYRGALLWMKKVSEELDPDAYKQLDKFRSVQAEVRKSKEKFDKLKLDSMQKVDLLAASRCNMLSHVLALYQDTLLQFWAKTSRTMAAVADSFKGYQFYEFNMLKDLVDESRKLADRQSVTEEDNSSEQQQQQPDKEALDQKLSQLDEIFMREFRDDESGRPSASKPAGGEDSQSTSDLLGSLIEQTDDSLAAAAAASAAAAAAAAGVSPTQAKEEEEEAEDPFLRDLLGGDSAGSDEFSKEWLSVFGSGGRQQQGQAIGWDELLPAPLQNAAAAAGQQAAAKAPAGAQQQQQQQQQHKQQQQQQQAGGKSSDMSAWLSLFAELDPLANPDSLSKKKGQISDA